jgi:GNAT superfamily N-acetyltransferase
MWLSAISPLRSVKPMIPHGYTDLAPGKIAAIVTYLEMLERPRDTPTPSPLVTLRKVQNPSLQWYREIFRRAGEPWLWWSRIEMADAQLSAVLNAPTNEVFIAENNGAEAGMAELDRSQPGQVEIAFFGLYPEWVGKGLGRPFMDALLQRAWSAMTSRVWVHTCTLDSPAALPFYLKCGFRPYKRAVEVADDPRLRGVLPESAAPHLPIIR